MIKLIIVVVLCHFVNGENEVKADLWQSAVNARFIIHRTGWLSLGTISTETAIKGSPFVGLESFSDGTQGNSTGIPYVLLTQYDPTVLDAGVNNRVSLMATLAQTDYCKKKSYNPQDPRCARVLMTGNLLKVPQSSAEYIFGLQALYSKHPEMENWPKDHNWFLAKIELVNIQIFDSFGGIKNINIPDYFHQNVTANINNYDSYL